MLMEEGRAESLGLADCYSGVTFLFCFCFIISVYAPLNSPSTRRLTQHNKKKLHRRSETAKNWQN